MIDNKPQSRAQTREPTQAHTSKHKHTYLIVIEPVLDFGHVIDGPFKLVLLPATPSSSRRRVRRRLGRCGRGGGSGRGLGLHRRRPAGGARKGRKPTVWAAARADAEVIAAGATSGRPLLQARHLLLLLLLLLGIAGATAAASAAARGCLLAMRGLLLLLLSAVELALLLLLLQGALLLLLLGRHQVRAAVRLFDGLHVDFVPVMNSGGSEWEVKSDHWLRRQVVEVE